MSALGDWVDAIGEVDRTLGEEAKEEHETTPTLPAVRGQGETLVAGAGIKHPEAPVQPPRKLTPEEAAAEKQKDTARREARKKDSAAAHTHNYFDQWDKFDVDGELEALDEDDSEGEEEEEEEIEMDGTLPPELSKLKGTARQQASVREKDTGNEYIRSGDPKRAIRHYNRAVELDASVGA